MTNQPPPGGSYPPPPPPGDRPGAGYQPPSRAPGGASPSPGGPPPLPDGAAYPPPPAAAGGYAPPPPGPAVRALPPDAYTPWVTRVLAYLIDSIPIAVLYGISWGITLATVTAPTCSPDSNGYMQCSGGGGGGIAAIVSMLVWLIIVAYAVWNWGYKQGTTGSSIGKGVMKFKVVSEKTGEPIGFGMSVVRQLAHFVDSLICGLGYLFPLWDAKRQTLADKIMTTVCLPL